MKSINWLRIFLTAGCFLAGLLAGGNIERYVVQFPAWHHLDIRIWGVFSRHADLANGLFLYPFEAIGSFLLLITSSVILSANKEILRQAAFPVYTATVFSAIGLILTFFAAPVMLSVNAMGNDASALQIAFDRFYYWSFFRGIAQVLSFLACIWAVGKT